MQRRAPETLVDWLVVGIAPFLIMLLVGSLVFYLVEVFYLGDYQMRLLWVLGLFVMAVVCIARISMEEGAAYASLYAAPLAGAVGLALATFVEVRGPLAAFGPGLNWMLMGIVWWAAHKLTWDCTLIEGGRDFTGQGLMQTTGLDRFFRIKPAAQATAAEPAPQPPPEIEGTSTTTHPPALPVWQWWLQKNQRPHAPGVWVVYFSIAALPLFGLGQWFIPSADISLRRRAFWLLVVYVAAGLSLLMATSFLSLRRYLRQRNLQMPNEMAGVWLGTGTAMVIILLILASLLPRPNPEYSITHLAPEIKSPDLTSSRWGWGKEGAKSKPDASHTGTQGEPSKNSPPTGTQGTPKPGTQGGKQPGQSTSQQSSNDGQQSGGSSDQNQQQQNSSSGDSKSDPAKQQNSPANQSDPKANEPASQKQNPNADPGKSDPSKSPPQQPSENNSSRNNPPPPENSNNNSSQPNPPAESEQTPPLPHETTLPPPRNLLADAMNQVFAYLAHALKWLFYLLVAAVIAYYAWKHREWLLNAWQQLLKELRELWARWFGQPTTAPVTEPTIAAPPPKRFADYADPFATGLAARWSLAELVRYTFEALEARGREQNCPRGVQQTPLEYAAAVGQVEPAFASEFRSLADLYGQLAFAGGAVPPQSKSLLQHLWQRWK